MAETLFDDLTDVYEAMVDWPKRLDHEAPFYRRLFDEIGARHVLDVACGIGRHAAMFHSWGLDVEGSDISPAMIDRARATFDEPAGLRWVVRGFDEPVEATIPFDAAVCVGNSLALAPDLATAERAIGRMLQAVRPGGAVVVHVLNLWRLPDGPCTWQKCVRTQLPQGDVMILKGVTRSAARAFVHLAVATVETPPVLHTQSVPLLGLEAIALEETARRSGASTVQFFGDYRGSPYDRQQSGDLVMIARR